MVVGLEAIPAMASSSEADPNQPEIYNETDQRLHEYRVRLAEKAINRSPIDRY